MPRIIATIALGIFCYRQVYDYECLIPPTVVRNYPIVTLKMHPVYVYNNIIKQFLEVKKCPSVIKYAYYAKTKT